MAQKTRLKYYEIDTDTPLASGAFGIIYTGRKRETQQEVIVKRALLAEDGEQGGAAMNEIKVYNNTGEHTNIIKLLDYFLDEGSVWLVLEKCNLRDLNTYSKANQFDIDCVTNVIHQSAKGLNHLHSLETPIVHRDVKPENIFLTTHDDKLVVKIGDFGISKIANEEVCVDELIMSTDCGTSNYRAPEFWDDNTERYTAAVDVFSLGLVLEALVHFSQGVIKKLLPATALRKPNQHNIPIGVTIQHQGKDIPLVKSVEGETPIHKQCKELVTKMTQYSAGRRPNMKQVVEKMQKLNGVTVPGHHESEEIVTHQTVEGAGSKSTSFPNSSSSPRTSAYGTEFRGEMASIAGPQSLGAKTLVDAMPSFAVGGAIDMTSAASSASRGSECWGESRDPTKAKSSGPISDPTKAMSSGSSSDPTKAKSSGPSSDPTKAKSSESSSDPTKAKSSGPISEPTKAKSSGLCAMFCKRKQKGKIQPDLTQPFTGFTIPFITEGVSHDSSHELPQQYCRIWNTQEPQVMAIGSHKGKYQKSVVDCRITLIDNEGCVLKANKLQVKGGTNVNSGIHLIGSHHAVVTMDHSNYATFKQSVQLSVIDIDPASYNVTIKEYIDVLLPKMLCDVNADTFAVLGACNKVGFNKVHVYDRHTYRHISSTGVDYPNPNTGDTISPAPGGGWLIASQTNSQVHVFTVEGEMVQTLGVKAEKSRMGKPGHFHYPHSIHIDSDNAIVVTCLGGETHRYAKNKWKITYSLGAGVWGVWGLHYSSNTVYTVMQDVLNIYKI